MKNNLSKRMAIAGIITLASIIASVPASAASSSASGTGTERSVYTVNVNGSSYQWSDLWNKLLKDYKPAHTNIIPSNTPSYNQAGQQSAKPSTNAEPSTNVEQKQPQQQTQLQQPQQTQTQKSDYAAQVVDLVNQERAKKGLQPLKNNSALAKVAMMKAQDMYNNDYFDHNSPTLGSPFDLMKSQGVTYRYAGENIAQGQPTPQEVMKAWMNSPGHRQNIMNPNYTSIGVAYYNGEWVQQFIG